MKISQVSIFMLVGIFLSGAALGYWIVRKFILSDDGTVDVGVVQFVKWAMRVIAIVLIFEAILNSLFCETVIVIIYTFVTEKCCFDPLAYLNFCICLRI